MNMGAAKLGIGSAVIDKPVANPVTPASPKLQETVPCYSSQLDVAFLTGGQDPHYAVGLGVALMDLGVALDVIGSEDIDRPEFRRNSLSRFYNLHGSQGGGGLAQRISRILFLYARLCKYAITAKPKIFHILWNNKVQILDRTLLMLVYKCAGKKIVFTAHNVNAGRRDKKDSWLNRSTLKFQYKLTDHIFVHTKKMKDELVDDFKVSQEKVTVISYGINNAVPYTDLTSSEARGKLGLQANERVILYYGAIKEYKGLEYLVAAFQQIAAQGDYRLIIAGEQKKGHEEYWRSIQKLIDSHPSREKIMQKIEFVPDAETEVYFKASDVAVLSYVDIFQSGILFLAYNYGLPVIATDVGSFSQEIIEGETGFICKPRNSDDLAGTLERYFGTALYRELGHRRQGIRDFALSTHAWNKAAESTINVYCDLVKRR